MFVGILHLELRIPGSHSLKDKRQVLKSLIETMRNRFNASVAEVDQMDAWQSAVVGVACVANDRRFLDQVLSRIEAHVAGEPRVEIVHSETEIL
jgi:uncharacterized protein